jgi:hypothetical protein
MRRTPWDCGAGPDLNPVDWAKAGAGAVTSAWNQSVGTFDWGTTAAGVFNIAYGGYKIVSGAEAAAASIGLLFAPPPFDVLAIPRRFRCKVGGDRRRCSGRSGASARISGCVDRLTPGGLMATPLVDDETEST